LDLKKLWIGVFWVKRKIAYIVEKKLNCLNDYGLILGNQNIEICYKDIYILYKLNLKKQKELLENFE